MVWIDAPKWLSAAVVRRAGLGRVITFPDLWSELGAPPARHGAPVACSTRSAPSHTPRPARPHPEVFGYHEVFHAYVTAAAAVHYAVIAFAVLPKG